MNLVYFFIISSILVLGTVLIAIAVDRNPHRYKLLVEHPLTYSLGIAVYCTSWTYYGIVGQAANAGVFFFGIYLGAILLYLFGGIFFVRMIRIKQTYHITNIADFLSARYDSSLLLAMLVTCLCVLGILPYIALQIKSISTTALLLTTETNASTLTQITSHIDSLILFYLAVLTITLGVRKTDPSEHSPGMTLTIALGSMLKLIFLLIIGVFVVFYMFNGFSDLWYRLEGFLKQTPRVLMTPPNLRDWLVAILLGAASIICLPRQFHMAIIENYNEKHVFSSMVVFPFYIFLITLFTIPIAVGGILKGIPLHLSDSYVLLLPLFQHNTFLALLSFTGGIIAATSMIVVSVMTLTIMVSNFFIIPLCETVSFLKPFRRFILCMRWLIVICIIGAGILLKQKIGESYMLVNMGMISFAAVAQLAPALLGGILWQGGTKRGALAGIGIGAFLWLYTLFVPALIKSGFIHSLLLVSGPFSISALRPENLFGLFPFLSPLSHSVMWSLSLNTIAYIVVSLLSQASIKEQLTARDFCSTFRESGKKIDTPSLPTKINLSRKLQIVTAILSKYVSYEHAKNILTQCLSSCALSPLDMIDIVSFSHFHKEIEKRLSGIIGIAMARKAFYGHLYTPQESMALSDHYARMLTDLKLSPVDLQERIDYYKEKEQILTQHAHELQKNIDSLKVQIALRKNIEKELQLEKNHAEHVIHASPVAIFTTNEHFIITRWNNQAATITGYATEEAIGKSCESIFQACKETCIYRRDHFHETPHINNQEVTFHNKKGERVTILKNIHGLYNHQGVFLGIIESFMDITERKHMEDELRKLGRVVNESPTMVLITDAIGNIEYVNPRFTQVTGYTLDEVKGKNPRFLNSGFFDRSVYTDLWNTIQRGDEWHGEFQNKKKDGTLYWESSRISSLKNTSGLITHYLAIKEDITERKNTEVQINKAHQELEIQAWGLQKTNECIKLLYKELESKNKELLELDKTKSDFISTVSHELRTPLTIIREGVSQILDNLLGPVSEEQRQFLLMTLSNIDRLSRMINDLLDMSRIEAGKITLQKERFDMVALLTSVYKSFEKLIEEKGITFTLSIPGETLYISVDKDKIIQVFTNLIYNAIKFTERGSIEIGMVDHEEYIECYVSDTGIGISNEHIPRLFSKFHQIDRIHGPGHKGSGLGLSIAKGIIELHKGTIWATSTVGVGSKFSFTLPKY